MENPFELILERLDRIERAIEKINIPKDIPDDESAMDIEELSKYLNISKSGIYGLTNRKTIPHYKVGKKLYFRKSEIEEWILAKKVKTKDEIENEALEYIRTNPRFISLGNQIKKQTNNVNKALRKP